MGVAGTGKSTFCREVLRRIQAVYLDNNHIADAFFPDTRTGPAYNRLRGRLYKALYTIAEENLMIGNSVVLDAPHVKEIQTKTWRTFITQLASAAKAHLVIIRCICSEKTLRVRIRRRGERRDARKFKHWDSFLTEQPLEASIPLPHLDINTENHLAKNLPLAVGYILDNANGSLKGAAAAVRHN